MSVYWALSRPGPHEFDPQTLAQQYIADNGTKVDDRTVSAWLAQRARQAEHVSSVMPPSRAASATAASWQSAACRASEVAAAVREIASPENPEAAEVASMTAEEWSQQRTRFVKDKPEAEKDVGLFGAPQARVRLADRMTRDPWKDIRDGQH